MLAGGGGGGQQKSTPGLTVAAKNKNQSSYNDSAASHEYFLKIIKVNQYSSKEPQPIVPENSSCGSTV